MPQKALVFVNIGTPEELSKKSVAQYLKKFLMDKYVIDIPFLFRWILVNLIIVPFRAKNSLEAYKKVWKEEGSPLDIYTKNLVSKSQKKLGDKWHVTYAMSYSKPFIKDVLNTIKGKNIKDIYYLPMYPQYADSTTKSSLEELKRSFKKESDFNIYSLSYFFNDTSFLEACTDHISDYLKEEDKKSHILFSFHGLPFRHVKRLHPETCENSSSCCESFGDHNRFCYRAQCHHTAKILADKLGVENYSYSFQSRLGNDQWLLPYSVNHVKELAEKGEKDIVVLPYAFTIDCLETEEEVEGEIKEAFMSAGGSSFKRVPCLNEEFYNVLTPDFFDNFSTVKSLDS